MPNSKDVHFINNLLGACKECPLCGKLSLTDVCKECLEAFNQEPRLRDLNKKCNCCGKIHTEVPHDAKNQEDENGNMIGWFWQCDCKSTMFKKI